MPSRRFTAAAVTVEELVEEAKRRSVLFLLLVLTVAYCMSLTSDSVLFNIPVAIVILALVRRISLELVVRWRTPQPDPQQRQHKRLSVQDPLISSKPSLTEWRSKIESPPVEAAVDEFTHKIVDELVTNLWYSNITPDQEVPQEIRTIINGVIGEISARAKQVNLINLLTRDIVNLVASHLELYREIQASIGAQYLETLSSDEREQKIKDGLESAKKLHPAASSLAAECQVLQKMMGGLLAIVMKPEDANCKLARCLARELLACAVMRPIMNFASPRFINEIIETCLRNGLTESNTVALPAAEASQLVDSASSRRPEKDSVSGVEMAEVGRNEDDFFQEDTGRALIASSKANAVKVEPGQLYTARSGDWAHAIEVFNQRKTQALAPEHLDNLWAKGRNYKKKDAKKRTAKAGDLEQSRSMEELTVDVPQGMSELQDIKSTRDGESSVERIRTPVSLDDDYYGKSRGQSRVIFVGEDSIGVRNATSVSRVIHHPLETPAEVSQEENLRRPGHRRSLSSGGFERELVSAAPKKQKSSNTPGYKSKLSCKVIGAHYEKAGSKSFAVYSISVSDEDRTWVVLRRYRNFEQLHRRLRDMPHYTLSLPPKRFLSSNLDSALVRERCISLNKYLKDLLCIPSIAELHEVWDFLSTKSQNYGFGDSVSIMKTLAVNMDDAVDDVFRQIKGVSEGVLKTASGGLKKNISLTEETGAPMNYSLASDDDGEAGYGTGWHSDSEVHHKSGTNMLGASFSDGHSPVESLAESELAEEDTAAQEWNPPKMTVPLLNLVNVVFKLEERGWIRRQVLWIAKQVLQLGMSDAIDDWLLSRVQDLRREDVIVSGIKWIQEALWPDGVFLIKHPKFRSSHSPGKTSSAAPQYSFEEQLEAARRAMVVRDLLQDRAPMTIVSLIGRRQYRRCASDIYGFIQSGVCVKQLAYSLLEKLLAAAFPELEDLISELHSSDAWQSS